MDGKANRCGGGKDQAPLSLYPLAADRPDFSSDRSITAPVGSGSLGSAGSGGGKRGKPGFGGGSSGFPGPSGGNSGCGGMVGSGIGGPGGIEL